MTKKAVRACSKESDGVSALQIFCDPYNNRMTPRSRINVAARTILAIAVLASLMIALVSRPAKRLIDFDQSFYLTIAYDLYHHRVFSNGVFDDVDSTSATPPPGMFFAPLFPALVVAAMKTDARFAQAVTCAIEANEKKRPLESCEVYARPIHIIHAILLTLAVLGDRVLRGNYFLKPRDFFLHRHCRECWARCGSRAFVLRHDGKPDLRVV